ncbi:MAG: ribosomal protection-like ABC-F family protein [Ktedonobacterales bacterium]
MLPPTLSSTVPDASSPPNVPLASFAGRRPLLLAARGVAKSYGAHTILSGISLSLNGGDRVGLVGANGAGKTTLLRILTGELAPDGGSVTIANSVEIGYLAQVTPDFPGSTIDDLIRESVGGLRRMEERMRALEAAMTTPASSEADQQRLAELLDEYGQLALRFQDRGGYELDACIGQILAGLRLDYLQRNRDVASLSGGERARIRLAALLLRSPDLLLLDEPTNHLDFATLAWLEVYLAASVTPASALLVVSHDRQFLNAAVTRIVEIGDSGDAAHQLRVYEGNYDGYAAAKQVERRRWEEDYTRQQEEIAALRKRTRETARQVAHNRPATDNDKFAKNFFGGRVERTISHNVRAAEQKLARIEAEPIPRPPKPLRFLARFRSGGMQSPTVALLEGVTKRLGGRELLAGVDLAITPETRLTLVGPNGAGKTTLLRLLLGQEQPDAGAVRRSPAAQFGYLAQDPQPLEALGAQRTVLEVYRAGMTGPDANFIAGLIGYGLFQLEDVNKPVDALSPGQQRKLEIARLLAQRPNALLLDEPTNYISLDVLEMFETALLAFAGPIVAVSHDRAFLHRFGGDTLELTDGKLICRSAGEYLGMFTGES